MRVQDAPGTILLEPLAQPWPLTQERFVRHLDDPLGHREEPPVGEDADHVGDVLVPLRVELGERHPTANDRVPFAGAGEAEHHRPGDRLLLGAEAAVHLLGQSGDRTTDAARLEVGVELDRPPLSSIPQLEQRGRQQGERARLVTDLGHQCLGERGLDVDAHAQRRLFDRPAILIGGHRTDEHVVGAEERGQRRDPRRTGRRGPPGPRRRS